MRWWADELDRKWARSCHQNECLRKSAFKVGLLPLSRTSISSTCWCQGAPEVSAPLLVADVRSLSWRYAQLLSTRKASCVPSRSLRMHRQSCRWAPGRMASCSVLRLQERMDWLVTVVRQFFLVDCISRSPRIRTKLDRTRVDCATSIVNANIRGRSRTTVHVSDALNTFGHQGRRGNFSRVRQAQWDTVSRLVC